MLPNLLLLHQPIATSLLQYRTARVSAAAKRAASFGFEGADFPWESASTGVDCVPWVGSWQWHHNFN